MGRKSRAKADRQQEGTASFSGNQIPERILSGAHLAITHASKLGVMDFNLEGKPYRKIDEFDIGSHRMEIGSIGKGVPRISNKRARQFFELATSIARVGQHDLRYYSPRKGTFGEARIFTHEHEVDGYLAYIPTGMVKVTLNGSDFKPNSFTNGASVIAPGEACVSFVTSDATLKPAMATTATATEIMQNRCIVSGFQLDGGKRSAEQSPISAFQETLANSVGNFAGAVAVGWTYKRYTDFMEMYERTTHLWYGQTKGLLGRTVEIVAPHLMVSQDVYDQVGDGQNPDAIDFIARKPLKS